jgi:hypothetical protein
MSFIKTLHTALILTRTMLPSRYYSNKTKTSTTTLSPSPSSMTESTEDKSHGTGDQPPLYLPHNLTRFQLPGFGLPVDFAPFESYDTGKWNKKKKKWDPVHVESAGKGPRLLPNALNAHDLYGRGATCVRPIHSESRSLIS